MFVKPEDLFWFLKFVSLWLFFFPFPFCSLFTSGLPFFLHRHKNSQTVISHDMHGDAYLALATSSVSEKMKRCLSCVCRPVFSCAWAWPRNRRPGHSARKLWTRGQDSGLTGVRQLSLREEHKGTHTQKDKQSQVFQRYPQRRWILWFGCGWSTGFGPKLCL